MAIYSLDILLSTNLDPVHFSKSNSSRCFFTCIQTSQAADKVFWCWCFLKHFPVCCDPHSPRLFCTQWGELHVLLEFSSFICDPADVGNLLLSSSAFSKSRLSVLKFLVHLPLKTWRLWTFLFQYVRWVLLLVVWTFFDMPFLWDRNESWTLPVVWPMLSFPSMLAYWISTFTTSSFRIWNSSAGIPSPFLALFLLVVP